MKGPATEQIPGYLRAVAHIMAAVNISNAPNGGIVWRVKLFLWIIASKSINMSTISSTTNRNRDAYVPKSLMPAAASRHRSRKLAGPFWECFANAALLR